MGLKPISSAVVAVVVEVVVVVVAGVVRVVAIVAIHNWVWCVCSRLLATVPRICQRRRGRMKRDSIDYRECCQITAKFRKVIKKIYLTRDHNVGM